MQKVVEVKEFALLKTEPIRNISISKIFYLFQHLRIKKLVQFIAVKYAAIMCDPHSQYFLGTLLLQLSVLDNGLILSEWSLLKNN